MSNIMLQINNPLFFMAQVTNLQRGDVEHYPYLCPVAMGPLRVVTT